MSIAVTVNRVDQGLDSTYVYGTLAFSGSYTTGGDTLNMSGLNWNNALIPVTQPPVSLAIFGAGGFAYGPPAAATSISNTRVKVTQLSTGSELAAGAYPAGVTTDYVQFEAVFPSLQ